MKNINCSKLNLSSSLLIVLIFCSCGGGSNGGGGAAPTAATTTTGMRSSIDVPVSSTKGFVIATDSSVSKSYNPKDSSLPKLFALTATNRIQRIHLDSDDAYQVQNITDTSSFAFFTVTGVTSNGVTCSTVAMQKSSGSLFCIPLKFGICNAGGGNPVVQKLSTGDIFYASTSQAIQKIDLSNPAKAVTQAVVNIPSENCVNSFSLNPNGDLFVWNAGTTGYLQIYKADGSIQNITSYDNQSYAYLTVGPNGSNDFYAVYQSTNSGAILVKIAYSSGSFTTTTLETAGVIGNLLGCGIGASAIIGDKIYLIDGCSASTIYKATSVVGSSVRLTPAPLTLVKTIAGYGAYVLVLGTDVSGNGGIVRYDTIANSFTTLLTPGSYTISKMTVSSAGLIGFSGVRNSDAANVIGSIDTAGNVTVTSSSVSSPVTQIQEISTVSCLNSINGIWKDQDIIDTLILNSDCSGTDSYCGTIFTYTIPANNAGTMTITKTNGGTGCIPIGSYSCQFTATTSTLITDCGYGTNHYAR